jgi:hypothetical protein
MKNVIALLSVLLFIVTSASAEIKSIGISIFGMD